MRRPVSEDPHRSYRNSRNIFDNIQTGFDAPKNPHLTMKANLLTAKHQTNYNIGFGSSLLSLALTNKSHTYPSQDFLRNGSAL